jgi:hypothetical protein
MNAPTYARSRGAPGVGTGVLAPVGFLGAYLAVSPVSGAFADRPLPLPGSPARRWPPSTRPTRSLSE